MVFLGNGQLKVRCEIHVTPQPHRLWQEWPAESRKLFVKFLDFYMEKPYIRYC